MTIPPLRFPTKSMYESLWRSVSMLISYAGESIAALAILAIIAGIWKLIRISPTNNPGPAIAFGIVFCAPFLFLFLAVRRRRKRRS